MNAVNPSSVLDWLSGLVVKSGRMAWQLRDQDGSVVDLELALGADVLQCKLGTPKRGNLSISGDRLIWQPPTGAAVEKTLSDPGVLNILRAGPQLNPSRIFQTLSSLPIGDLPDVLDWIGNISADVTVLVIPGISAFGIKIPPLRLGGLSLPAIGGDVSLRNLAIDLSGGHVGFELRIHDAEAFPGPDLAVDFGSVSLTIREASFKLAADVIFDISSGQGIVTIDWLTFSAQSLSGSCQGAGGQSADLDTGILSGQGRSIVFDIGQSGVEVPSGEFDFMSDQASVTLSKLDVGPLSAADCVADTKGLGVRIRLYPGGSKSTLSLDKADISVNAPQIAGFPSTSPVTFQGPIQVSARGVELTIPQLVRGDGIVDVEGTIDPLSIALSGLTLDLQSHATIRAEAAVNGADLRFAAMLKFASAKISSPSAPAPISISNARAKHAEIQPMGILDVPKRILKSQGVDEISLTISIPPIPVSPAQEIAWPADEQAYLHDLFSLLRSNGVSVPSWADDVVNNIGPYLSFDSALGLLGGAVSFLAGLDGTYFLVGVRQVVVAIDGPKTDDRTLTFRVSSGFKYFGARIAYHYPSPTWDDPFRQAHDHQDFTFPADLALPDLMVETNVFFDAAAKRIRLTAVSLYFDVGGAAGEIVQKLAEAYYHVTDVIQGIVNGINASLPSGLPDTWDVADLSIEKTAGVVNGFSITMRATETDFDTI